MIQDYLDLAVSAVNPIHAKDAGHSEFSDGKKLSPDMLKPFHPKAVEIIDEAVTAEPEGNLISRFTIFLSDSFSETSLGKLFSKNEKDEAEDFFPESEFELTDTMEMAEEENEKEPEPEIQPLPKTSALEMNESIYEEESSNRSFDEPSNFSRYMDENDIDSFQEEPQEAEKTTIEDSMLLLEADSSFSFDRINSENNEQVGEDMKPNQPVNDFEGIPTGFTLEDGLHNIHFDDESTQNAKPANDLGHNIHIGADDVLDLGNNLFITGDKLDFIEFVDQGWDKLSEPLELSGDIDAREGYDTFVHENGAIVHIEHLISTNYDDSGSL